METTHQIQESGIQRVRRLASALVLGAGAALGAIRRPTFRRGLAAAGMAAALASGSVLTPRPAAADTTYAVTFSFLNVSFSKVNDGSGDNDIEVYGSLSAQTGRGAVSANGLPFRNFATWGKNPSGCPSDGVWWDGFDAQCLKTMYVKQFPYQFEDTWLCASSSKTTCGGTYGKNRAIQLNVFPGEVITIAVDMGDYDALSANDTVCKGFTTIGPFSASELQSKAYRGKWGTIHMAYNGHAECTVSGQLI